MNKTKKRLQKEKENGPKKGWYYTETKSGGYYDCIGRSKPIYELAGSGKDKPTPNDVLKKLEEDPDYDMAFGNLLMVRWDVKDSSQEAVTLPGGFYYHKDAEVYSQTPERLVPTTLRDDTLLEINDLSSAVVSDIQSFLAGEKIYRDLGILYRRGMLLYGPPGTGKTSLLRHILKSILPKDAIVIFMDQMMSNDMMNKIKEIEADRLKVFVFEELAAVIENCKIERVLDFLDGERSIDKSLVIGTTNYPERLPGNLVDRPSRFDKLYKVGIPSKESRLKLLKHYLSTDTVSDKDLDLTKEFSIAAIKESCLFARLKGLSLEEGIKAMKKHKELVKSDFAEEKKIKIGISSGDDDDSLWG
jgi:hypothetical protein